MEKHNLGGYVAVMGDSTIDNAKYVGEALGTDQMLTELFTGKCGGFYPVALDGAVCSSIEKQVKQLPQGNYDHIVLSVGGNDALGYMGMLAQPLVDWYDAVEEFEEAYTNAVKAVMALNPDKLTLCTIYEGWFDSVELRQATRAGVRMFNDAIQRVALDYGHAVVDLRSVCRGEDDFTLAIEPSAQGAAKIARRLAWEVLGDAGETESEVPVSAVS